MGIGGVSRDTWQSRRLVPPSGSWRRLRHRASGVSRRTLPLARLHLGEEDHANRSVNQPRFSRIYDVAPSSFTCYAGHFFWTILFSISTVDAAHSSAKTLLAPLFILFYIDVRIRFICNRCIGKKYNDDSIGALKETNVSSESSLLNR